MAQSASVAGTERGIMTQFPVWQMGLQIATSNDISGVVLQRAAVMGGALNLGVGNRQGHFSAHGEQLFFFNEDLDVVPMNERTSQNSLRGKVHPFTGIGLGIGRGMYIRFPLGMQYTMRKDPVNFFGGLLAVFGNFFDDEKMAAGLGLNLGVRMLL
jgi:hypothetical protein